MHPGSVRKKIHGLECLFLVDLPAHPVLQWFLVLIEWDHDFPAGKFCIDSPRDAFLLYPLALCVTGDSALFYTSLGFPSFGEAPLTLIANFNRQLLCTCCQPWQDCPLFCLDLASEQSVASTCTHEGLIPRHEDFSCLFAVPDPACCRCLLCTFQGESFLAST